MGTPQKITELSVNLPSDVGCDPADRIIPATFPAAKAPTGHRGLDPAGVRAWYMTRALLNIAFAYRFVGEM